ncbi:type III pantothenate kinase [Sulfuriferula nivalis]|uniref:Type III pantothenate kinase n=1 Tax=Sulfuriferula nivalis TaxID=2675298 RepID=A0A809RN62_9PROT|nr:type III pantothenate kinase [Sulfuriferula nivalis]BBP02214.1 type III pantothenate kinase [Sulfuriferula nivalis]
MNLLLIDAGNTRIKWRRIGADGERRNGYLSHAQVDQLAELTGIISHIIISNVAGAALGARINQQYPSCAQYILTASTQQCGVHSHYQPATQLGSDRWAALIGAHHLGANNSIIVSAGTAITVDALSHGEFLGGIIMPGTQLMHSTLSQNTAQLPRADGYISEFPSNTADAITTGCMLALTSAITAMQERLTTRNTMPTDIWLHGGDATTFSPLLPHTPHLVDNLVLTGLEVIAHEVYT